MKKNRFNIFSAEEFDDSVVEGQGEVSESPVADAIEAENDAVEINNEVSTFEEQCDGVCEATQVVDELQEQVDAQEEVLEENPEEVTEDTVVAAQEEFYITMSKLGSLEHYSVSGRISQEASAGTPAEKLKLSCEGVKDFIEKVWEKIKAFFKRIIDWFKSILQKIGIMRKKKIDDCSKAAEEISKLPDDIDTNAAATAAPEESIENLHSILGFWGAESGQKTVDWIFKNDLKDILMKISENGEKLTPILKRNLEELKAQGEHATGKLSGKSIGELKSYISSHDNLKLIKSKLPKVIGDKLVPYVEKVAKKIEATEKQSAKVVSEEIKYDHGFISKLTANDIEIISIFTFKRDDRHYLKYNVTNITTDNTVVKFSNRVDASANETGNIKRGGVDNVKTILDYVMKNKSNLNKMLNSELNSFNAKVSKQEANVAKELDNVKKELDDVEKYLSGHKPADNSNTSFTQNVNVSKELMSIISKISAGSLNSVNDYLDRFKRLLAFSNTLLAKQAKK